MLSGLFGFHPQMQAVAGFGALVAVFMPRLCTFQSSRATILSIPDALTAVRLL
jgi:hypothetical protein